MVKPVASSAILEQAHMLFKKPLVAYLSSCILLVLIGLSATPLWSHNPLKDNFNPTTVSPRYQPSAIDLDQLHLFGVYTTSSAIPQSNLDLKLSGTVAAENANDAYALITDQSNNTKVYQIGDTLPGGAILNKIEKDRVIINDAGRSEAIILPKPKITSN